LQEAKLSQLALRPLYAHVAAFGFTYVATWRQHSGDLDERLHLIEIADPDEPAG
jgi:hypothetical protein